MALSVQSVVSDPEPNSSCPAIVPLGSRSPYTTGKEGISAKLTSVRVPADRSKNIEAYQRKYWRIPKY